ncbi:MAG: hypothetical protein ACRC46_01690 [Thermoguttaceae bacterium]
MTQQEQVIEAMRQNGGYATLGFLNQKVDVSKLGQEKERFAKITAALDWAKTHVPNDQTTDEILERLAKV